ncbi:hypothetical protein EJB05_25749, partial [Eragrostis curvula]
MQPSGAASRVAAADAAGAYQPLRPVVKASAVSSSFPGARRLCKFRQAPPLRVPAPPLLQRSCAVEVAPALRRMARSGSAAFVAVTGPARAVVAWLGLADVLCFLCDAPKALARPADALAKPVSALLPKDGAGKVRRVDPRAREVRRRRKARTEESLASSKEKRCRTVM